MGNLQQNQRISALAYGAIATIDLDAIAHNYNVLRMRVEPAACAAVIKADAYGLGAAQVGPTLYQAGCRIFFVAQLVEALHLKTMLPADVTIAILNGIQPGAEALTAEAGVVPVLNSWASIVAWQTLCHDKAEKLPAIIQIDTGMSRLGLDHDELNHLITDPAIFEAGDIRYIISHLASGDEAQNPSNQMQFAAMKAALAKLPDCPVAFANSGGIFLQADFAFNLVRPGIALYGVDPHGHVLTTIKPVLRLDARVIQSRHVQKGAAIGYGGSFTTTRPSIITTIAVGYADGWHRALGNKGAAYFDNQRLPIIGRVSMDSITLDATDLGCDALKPGDVVELIGNNQSLEDVARDAGTIPYEILTSLGKRYERIYLQNGRRVEI